MGVRLKLDVQGQGVADEFRTYMDKGMGGLENWKIFMDVICVPSLSSHRRCSIKKSALKSFAKFTGKRPV